MPEPFKTLTSRTVTLSQANIDTDQIIPARFLTTTTREGLGRAAFYDWRYEADGSEKPEAVLNRIDPAEHRILLAGRNFACGSSREHAPWALLDFGIRCVIAPDFADIFHNNCFKNGILPVRLPHAVCEKLMEDAKLGGNARLTVDLARQVVIRPDGEEISFNVDPLRKHLLLNGLDDIGQTMEHASAIDAFETRKRAAQPWMFGTGTTL